MMDRPALYRFLMALVALLSVASLVGCGIAPTPAPASVAESTGAPTGEALPAEPTIAPTPQTEPPAEAVAPRPATNTALSGFATADFSGPSICAMCHSGLTDRSRADVSVPTAWRSTMMANAAKDPVWQAKVSSEVARMPQLQAVIEEKCVTCHMPMAKTQAETEGQPVTALGDGFYGAAHPLHEAAIDGVSCTLCHQIREDNLGAMESFSGGYFVDTSTDWPNRPAFGPYEQPVTRQMENQTGFSPVYGAHMLTAEHCGTCHNLYTPYVDAQGNILGEFPEQTPYTEWQHSRFGAETTSCQTCHMPLAQGGVVISLMPGWLGPREPFYQHHFVGGNAFMLDILGDWGADMEVTADAEHLQVTQARVVDQIGNRSVRLTLAALEMEESALTVTWQVAPLTGHKFPTSFPSRRAWLHVTVADATGQMIFESGQPNADGTIAGNDADADPAAFEPHYDLITQPDQVQIYEPIMGDSDGKVTYTLLRAAEYLKDNRLLPEGTDKAQLPADIAVYGQAAHDDDFAGGGDEITYRVDVTGGQGPFTVRAEVLYEPLSYRFVQDLLSDGTPLTERFGDYYDQADKAPLVAATLTTVTTEAAKAPGGLEERD